MPLKAKLLGSCCAIVVGLAITIGTPTLANAALVCTSGSILGAGSCSETVTLGPASTDLTNQILTIDKWVSNAASGFTETLQDVVFSFSGSISSTGTITNTSTSTQTTKISVNEDFTFAPGAGAPSNFLVPAIDVSGSTPLQTFTLASGATTPYSATLTLGPTSSGLITALLSQYTGPGTFDALLTTLTGLTLIGGGGNVTATQSTSAIGQIDVTYDFLNAVTSQTPLPAALPMFAGGLGALGLFGWRRRRKSAALAA